jgi:tetratricopeptide (TPR) repeat protein
MSLVPPPPPALSRVARLCSRPWRLLAALARRPKAAAAAALALALAAGCGLHLWATSEERAARRAIKEEHYADARRHVDHCLTVWRRSASTELLAARVARLQFDYPAAEAHLRRSAELSGGATAATQLEWLLLRAQAGDVDEVAPGLLRLVDDNDPESPAILEALSGVYVRQVRLPLAMHCLNLWLKCEPDALPALDRRGWTWERLHNRDAARADWERALELAPDRWETRLRLAELFLDDANPVEAGPHVERLRQTHPERAEVWGAVGRCRYLNGDLKGAAEALDRVLAEAPDDPKGLLWRAKVDLEQGRPAEAEALLRRALARDPSALEAQFALTESLRRQPGRAADAAAERQRYDRLKADVERLTSLMGGEGTKEPETADRCAEVGALLLRLGRAPLARQWLRRALALDDKCVAAHKAMADCCEQEGDLRGAEQHRRLAEGQEP